MNIRCCNCGHEWDHGYLLYNDKYWDGWRFGSNQLIVIRCAAARCERQENHSAPSISRFVARVQILEAIAALPAYSNDLSRFATFLNTHRETFFPSELIREYEEGFEEEEEENEPA